MKHKIRKIIILILMLFNTFGILLNSYTFAQEENCVLEPQYGMSKKFLALIEEPDSDSIPISTRDELEAIKNNLSGKYHLTADIDLSGSDWTPIGDNSDNSKNSRFTGVFDGQGYTIYNLTVSEENNIYGGLFGYADGGMIKNVGVENISIEKAMFSGAICGVNNSLIYNCYSRGLVASNEYSGGICARNYKDIEYCYSLCDVSVDNDDLSLSGGICGQNFANLGYCFNKGKVEASSESYAAVGGICGSAVEGSMVTRSYNTGTIDANAERIAYIGGICGWTEIVYSVEESDSETVDKGNTIKQCYNTGDLYSVSVYPVMGGICGGNECGMIISECYNAGNIYSSFDNIEEYDIGGICGYSSYDVSNCYWDIEKVQKINSVDLTDEMKKGIGSGEDTSVSLYSKQMKKNEKLVGFDFKNIWGISQVINGGYPYLKNVKTEYEAKVYPYEIGKLSLMSYQGEDISTLPLNQGFIVDVEITEHHERSEKDYIFVAVYDTDGMLLSLDYAKANFAVNSTCSFGFSIPAQEKPVGSVKVYVWNSFNGMEPLAESKVFAVVQE